jgi:hypothetical protein
MPASLPLSAAKPRTTGSRQRFTISPKSASSQHKPFKYQLYIVSDPDPQGFSLILIGWTPDPDPGGQNDPQKYRKKLRISSFEFLDVLS